MSTTPKLAVSIAKVATIDADLPCFFCQYNLRTLALDGICPECGNPVVRCIRQDWLDFADPCWLAELRRGVTIMLWLILVAVLGCAALFALLMYSAMAPSPSGAPTDFFVVRAFTMVFGLGLAVSWFIGAWHLTAPEPIPNEGHRQPSLRRTTRTLQLIFGCSAIVYVVLVSWILAHTGFSARAPATSTDIMSLVASIISAVAWFVGFVLLLIHMRRIARRDLHKGLSRLMTFVIWGGLATVSTQVMMPLLTNLAMWPTIITPTTAPAAGPAKQGMATTQAYATSVGVSARGSTTATRVRTSTMPAAVTAMPVGVGGTVPVPFGGNYMLRFTMCASHLLAVAWFVAGVTALYLFRSVFARAIQQNVAHAAVAGA